MCNDKIRTPASDVSECNINWNAVFFLSSIHCILVSIPWKVLVYPRNKSVRASTIENWSVKPYSSESNEEITCLVGYWFQKKVIPDMPTCFLRDEWVKVAVARRFLDTFVRKPDGCV